MSSLQSSDLDFIRDMAESGQNAPLLGGRFLAWFGGLATIAYLGHYAIAQGMFGLRPTAFAVLWIGFVIVGGGGYALLVKQFPRSKPGAASAGNVASQLVWKAGGFALSAFFFSLAAASVAKGSASIGFLWSVPFVLAVYAIGQLTSGWMSQAKPLVFAGYTALAGCAVSIWFIDSNLIWVVGAAVAACAVLLPGLLLMKNEPSEIV